jgi:hypothetical protein
LREAWADKQPHRFLPFDRDAKFGADVVSAAKHRKSANTHGLSQSVAERCGGAPGGKLPPRLAGPRDHPEGAASQTAEVCILGLLPRGPDSSGTCEGHASGSAYSSSALEPKARFNPCRDSAACTIGMQRQRRVKSCCFSDDQTLSLVSRRGTVQEFCEDFRRSTNQPAIPSRRGCTE